MVALVGELGPVDLLPGLRPLGGQRRVVRVVASVGSFASAGSIGSAMSAASLLSYQSSGSALSHQSTGSVLSSQASHAMRGRRADGGIPPGLVAGAVLALVAGIAAHRVLRLRR